MKKTLLFLSFITFSNIAFSQENQTILDIASGNENFTTLVAVVQAAGLLETLGGDGPFTVFAPTDDAFALLPEETIQNLLLPENKDQLRQILLYHIVPGSLLAADVVTRTNAKTATANQQLVKFSVDNGSAKINEATIVSTDLIASNGVIHVIDQVIIPGELPTLEEVAVSAGVFNTLLAAVQAAGLSETLSGDGPFTIFAPTDDAFGALPEGTVESLLLPENINQLVNILLYHVVPGKLTSTDVVASDFLETLAEEGLPLTVFVEEGVVFLNDSAVTSADIEISNGIIHVIDSVLIPPQEMPMDIVDTAISTGIFDTLVAAVQAAGLEGTLRAEGPFTVFAPTDDAFSALPEGTVESLLLPENIDQLTRILLYHVVPRSLPAAEVVQLSKIKTATSNQQLLRVSIDGGSVMVDNATIVQTDVLASNGVIHVIDEVLIPADLPDIVGTAINAGSFNTLIAAVQAAGLEEALRSEGPFTIFAPTDAAFAKLPQGLIELLLQEENLDTLTAILTYHAVEGKVISSEVVDLPSATTVNGLPVAITIDNASLRINDSLVTGVDIDARNGVIHVIDTVLIPSNITLPSTEPTATPTPTIPPIEPTPTPTIPPVVEGEDVWVYDNPTDTQDLSGQTDFDSAGNRSLTIATNAPQGSAVDWHFYVQKGFGGAKFLGRTGSGSLKTLTWSNESSSLIENPAGPGITQEFLNGPDFNSVYNFRVVRIDDQLTTDDFFVQSKPVGFNIEDGNEINLVHPDKPDLEPISIYVCDDILGLRNLAPTGGMGNDVDRPDWRAIQIAWNFGVDSSTLLEYHVYVSVNDQPYEFLGLTGSGNINYFWWTSQHEFTIAAPYATGPQHGNTYQFLVFMIPIEGEVQSLQSGKLLYSVSE